jgi:HEPN domain-containing protein
LNAVVAEWVAKAEGDYLTASREFMISSSPNYDAVCFHAQQCVEKLMKAVLIDRGIVAPYTHDLGMLDLLLKPVLANLPCSAPDLEFLTSSAVWFRYPGKSAGAGEAKRAMEICGALRPVLIATL